MSYCRWSSADWSCDLYCYEGGHGYVTSVASSRLQADTPCPAFRWDGTADDMLNSYNAQENWMAGAKHVPIGGPHDGADFLDPTLEAFRARLIMLREAGYSFPDEVLARVDAEIAEASHG